MSLHDDNTVVNLNTKLVSLMVKGDYMQAAIQLERVTWALQDLVNDLEREANKAGFADVFDVLQHNYHLSCNNPKAQQQQQSSSSSLVFLSTADDLPPQHEIGGVLPFFNKAVFVQGSYPETTLPLNSRFHLAASILYNMALFWHKGALQTGDTHLLYKSVHFYGMAQNLIEPWEHHQQYHPQAQAQRKQQKQSQHHHQQDSLLTLSLALWNNLGHAQMLLANYQQARQCTEQMQCLLANATLDDTDAAQDDVCDFFFTASLGSSTGCFSISPAA